jgi:DNA-binding MarR family transcriptional regulator
MAARPDPVPADAQSSVASQAEDVIGTGFLLSALGAHSAAQYAQRIAPLGLTPPHVGLLRAIAIEPGQSQQSIADHFGMPPSRMVAFIDELEDKGLVERRRSATDRRVHSLFLTKAGGKTLRQLGAVGREAEAALLAPLSQSERRQLQELLGRVAAEAKMTPGVHPGYRRMKAERPDDRAPDCS